MSFAAAPISAWGERTTLLPKRMTYLFSMDLWFKVHPLLGHWIGDALAFPLEIAHGPELVTKGRDPTTYHVLDAELVSTVTGAIESVPRTIARRGRSELRIRRDSTATIEGRIVLEGYGEKEQGGPALDAQRIQNRIAVQCTGAVKLDRSTTWFAGIESSNGRQRGTRSSAFVAFRFESAHPRYRWLAISQFVGFGKAWVDDEKPLADLPADALGPYRRLLLSYDVHSAG